jgi:tRNA A37 threonylcarbamoyltransferase TsaD
VAEEAERGGYLNFAVSPDLAVDNAAMIAFVGRHKLRRGKTASLSQNAEPGLEL